MAESYVFTVNGVQRETTEEKSLLRYLRDDLHLHSVKDGCSEGACGTCTILVDGRATRACVLTTKKAAGKSILTVEGLSTQEKEAFVYAFGKVGAVQCGFCIPGMVMAGKALLDQEPNPPPRSRSRRPSVATYAAAPGIRRSSRASSWPRPSCGGIPPWTAWSRAKNTAWARGLSA